MSLKHWLDEVGALYFLASIGACLILYKLARQQQANPWMLIASFEAVLISVFYHGALKSIGKGFDSTFYGGSILAFLCVCAISRLSAYHQTKVNDSLVVLFCWFCVTLFLTRGAKRYGFFFGVPAAVLASHALSASKQWIAQQPGWKGWRLISWYLLIISVSILLTLPGFGGYAFKSYISTKKVMPLFASPAWQQAFAWLKFNLPSNAVVAADWNYGSHLNVLGKCATMIDEDHLIPYWIYLASRHVFCAQSEREALEFLKTRRATHLMFTSDDISNAHNISALGSNEDYDRRFRMMPLTVKKKEAILHLSFEVPSAFPYGTLTLAGTTHPPGSWHVEEIKIVLEKGEREENPSVKKAEVELALRGESAIIPLRRVFLQNHEYMTSLEKGQSSFPGGVILMQSAKGEEHEWRGFYVPEVGYNSLLVQMFLLDKRSEHFKQVYPPVEGVKSDIKIWEITYPGDIAFREEYLRQTFEDKRLKAAWMFGKE